MANLFGREISRKEILQKTGDISQLACIRPGLLTDGKEDGVKTLDFMTGSGLTFTVLPSRGMDISSAHYAGKPIAWRSCVSDAHPAYFEPQGLGWLRSFSGGLLTTCGLTYAGAPNTDEGIELGLHGRVNNIPAVQVTHGGVWDGDEYIIWAEGTVREASVFGHNITLTRHIATSLGSKSIFISDTVENCGFKPAEHQLLYHINIGWPVVSEASEFHATVSDTKGRNDYAEKRKDEFHLFPEPEIGGEEMVYYHVPKCNDEQEALAGIVNKELNYGVAVRYSAEHLTRLVQWKMPAEGVYVTGIEPANCTADGRKADREAGILQVLEPGEIREYAVIVEVLDGEDELSDFIAEVDSINSV